MRIVNYFPSTIRISEREYSFRDYFYRVTGFYRRLRRSEAEFSAFQDRIAAIARLVVEQIPTVRAAYGVGYPFYGNVYCLKRAASELMRWKGTPLQTEEIARRLLPDIDLLLVFDSDDGPFSMQPGMMEAGREAFVSASFRSGRQWKMLLNRLYEDFDIARRDAEPIDEFMEYGRLHIDFLPVPAHIWQELPYLVIWEKDLPELPFIRDLGFTCNPLCPKGDVDIPGEHRVNHVLFMLDKLNMAGLEVLLNHIIGCHPYIRLVRIFPETRRMVTALWIEGIRKAIAAGLVSESETGIVNLSEAGRARLSRVLARRERIYREGFTLPL